MNIEIEHTSNLYVFDENNVSEPIALLTIDEDYGLKMKDVKKELVIMFRKLGINAVVTPF